jgi:hypothetical protein
LAEPTTNRGFFATRYNGVRLPSATTSSCVNSIEPQPFTTPRQHRQCALHYRIARRFVIAGEEERVEMI